MEQITNEQMKKLIDKGYLKNTHTGFVDKRGMVVGFYRTRNKRYIEDKYVDIAKKLN